MNNIINGGLGYKGEPGVSPTIDVSKTSGVTTLTITDVEGTKTVTISDGEISKDMVVDNLTTTTTDVPLSANQGKVLKDLVDTKANVSDVYVKTDTYNKTEVNTKFNNLCGNILWTNPDAKNSFAAQTIQLDTDAFDIIEIYSTTSNKTTLVRFKTSATESGMARSYAYISSLNTLSSGDVIQGATRKADWNSNGIQFFDCYGTNGNTYNTLCIPVAIIGKYYHLFDYDE